MKRYIKSGVNITPSEAQGLPPFALVQRMKRKFNYDVDDYYGWMFNVSSDMFDTANDIASRYRFELKSDPDNDDWYYLGVIGE